MKGGDRNLKASQTERQRKTKKDKERPKRVYIDVRWWPQEPESGGEAQALVRLARDCGWPLPKTCEARVVDWVMMKRLDDATQ